MRFLGLLWQCLIVWRVNATSLEGAQVILAHAAGLNSDGSPGLVNEYSTVLIKRLHEKLQIPVIVQGELADCLIDIPLLAVSPRQGQSGRYIDTFDIAIWQKSICDDHNFKRVVLVSYLPHFWRGMRVTEKIGLQVCIPEGIKEIYDPENSQWWARSGWVNRPYELLVRFYYLFKGQI